MKPVFAKSKIIALSLACLTLFLGTIWNARGEMPVGLETALTSSGWSFPEAKAPIHFLTDGTVVDGNGTVRYDWTLAKDTGTVHLLERGPKSKDKARIDIWFWENLAGFSWYNSHGNSSGQGSRVEDTAQKPVATAPAPPSSAPSQGAPSPFDPKNLPSAQLQDFSAAWLEKILGPLNNTPLPRAQLMKLQTDYQARLALATPQQKPTLQAALQLCAAFGNIMDARERALTSLTNAEASTSTASGSTRSAHVKDDKRAQIRAAQGDSAFITSGAVSSVVTQWQQQEKPTRDAIQQLLVRERQAELVALAANPAASSAAAPSH